jgi:NADPH:quinone reductase-like Zn-dependent oxidoreductase
MLKHFLPRTIPQIIPRIQLAKRPIPIPSTATLHLQIQSYPSIPRHHSTASKPPMSSHPVFAEGNLAVITGGASGIGLALAQKCASQGMNVIICDNNASNLKSAKEAVKSKAKFETVEIDVSKLEDFERVKSLVEKDFDGISTSPLYSYSNVK